MAGIHRTEYQRAESSRERALEICKVFSSSLQHLCESGDRTTIMNRKDSLWSSQGWKYSGPPLSAVLLSVVSFTHSQL